jgi:hypothetical protein
VDRYHIAVLGILVELVLSSDLDWASEFCIENFLSIAERFSIKPTVFVTHASAAVQKASDEGRVELGVHPNFHQPSTHGDTIGSILDHVRALAPEATAVRSHRHFSPPGIENELLRRGLRIDSNTCRHLQPGLAPVELADGLLRLPVFFEDDIHWSQGGAWNFDACAGPFFSPGLKVLNFHPFFVALNVPDGEFYLRHKHHIPSLRADEAARLRHDGPGTATFLIDTIRNIQAGGHMFVTLGEAAARAKPGTLAA